MVTSAYLMKFAFANEGTLLAFSYYFVRTTTTHLQLIRAKSSAGHPVYEAHQASVNPFITQD
jgi:hypothetical protein